MKMPNTPRLLSIAMGSAVLFPSRRVQTYAASGPALVAGVMAAYEAALAGQGPPIVGLRTAKPGSFVALAASYFASPNFLKMKPSTKDVYRNAIDRLCQSKDKDGNEIGAKGAMTL